MSSVQVAPEVPRTPLRYKKPSIHVRARRMVIDFFINDPDRTCFVGGMVDGAYGHVITGHLADDGELYWTLHGAWPRAVAYYSTDRGEEAADALLELLADCVGSISDHAELLSIDEAGGYEILETRRNGRVI